MMSIFEQIGEKISKWLEEQNYTQSDLAERLGISKQVMSKIINGKKAINLIEIKQIAEIMGMTIDELVGSSAKTNSIEDPIMFMIGKIDNDKTKEQLKFLDHVMDEMIQLEKLLEA